MVVDMNDVLNTNGSAIDEYENYVKSDKLLNDSVITRFNKVDKDQYEVKYKIVNNAKDPSYTTSSNKNFCFCNLIYDPITGYSYFFPESNSVFIPLIDMCKFFKLLIKDAFGKDVYPDAYDIRDLFVDIKLGSNPSKLQDRDLLTKFINELDKSRAGTILSKLLYDTNNTQTTKVNIDEDSLQKFFNRFSKYMIKLTKLSCKAIESIDNPTGLLGTYKSVCKTVSPIFESRPVTKVEQLLDKGESSLVQELSTGIIFNPTARDYMDDLIDLSTSDGFTKNRQSEKNYDLNMNAINAADLSTTNTILDNYQNIATKPGGSADSMVTPSINGHKLLRISQISKLLDTSIVNNSKTLSPSDVLDDISNNDAELVNPDVYVLSDKLVNILDTILRRYRY